MYETVLLTLDGSELSEQALPHAASLAKEANVRLLLLRVVPLAGLPGESAGYLPLVEPNPYQQIVDAEMAEARDYLDRHVNLLRKEGISAESIRKHGIPARSILETIEEEHANVLVIATHGRSGIRRLVLGSVADELLRSAGIPVLLVRAVNPLNRTADSH